MAPRGNRNRPKTKETPAAADTAAIDALREDMGERAFNLLPKKVLDVETYTFAYKTDKPDTNPEATIWALMNALKGSTTKGQEAVDSTKVCPLS
jgi:hypothetical protein